MSRKPKSTYSLRIRSYPEGRFVSVWLLRRDGPASGSAGLLWGELLPGVADALADALGLMVERDSLEAAGALPMIPPGCASVEEQGTLFRE